MIRERGTIIGITSAATIFVVASIGMAVGAGLYVTGIFTSLLLLSALVVVGNIEQRTGLQMQLLNFRVTTAPGDDVVARAHQIVESAGIRARRWHTFQSDEGPLIEFEVEITQSQERNLLARLGTLKGRVEARPAAAVTPL